MANRVEQLTAELDSFDPGERRAALERLVEMARSEQVAVAEPTGAVNLHCHTFFSFNAYGYSPSRFAWEAYRRGLEAGGVVDFDCLDATREFLAAGRLLGLKTTAGIETRVFISEYADRVTNSPKEPGVSYLIGTGFTDSPPAGTQAAETLGDMGARARARNLRMLGKVNAHLAPVAVDYERDVLPLTAAGNGTERHMLTAYEACAREVLPDEDALAAFWSEKLNADPAEIRRLLDDVPSLKDLMRARLMKHGGVGYAQPDAGVFPAIEQVVAMTLECGAMPSAGWLDGTSGGEADPVELFTFLREKGCVCVMMAPDRNWNVPEKERAVKVANLRAAVEAACSLEMPIVVGTEMNKHGNKFVDDFGAEAVAPHFDEFRRGAHIAWGHTLLMMTAGVGYVGEWAEEHFGSDAAAKNEFFRRIGAEPYPGEGVMERCTRTGTGGGPDEFAGIICQ